MGEGEETIVSVVEHLGDVVAQGLLDVLGHGLGEHGVEHDLGQRPQPPDDRRNLGDVLALQRAVPQVSRDHLVRHGDSHVARDRVHVRP